MKYLIQLLVILIILATPTLAQQYASCNDVPSEELNGKTCVNMK